jgi:hypothetical protein
MDDALVVRVAEAFAQLNRDFELLLQRERRVVLEQRFEVAAAQELHHDVRRAFDFAQLVDRDHVLVLQARDGARFTLEPLAGGVVAGEVDVHHLQRDVALQHRIVRAVEHAHPAAPDELDDVVPADRLGWG